ncbi:MAG TPA: baseplate J/gp47 family protein [Anaerolineales bacterium]|nr:baseplate J/gp47 family protein [Anaerolineales bacterium]
MKTKIITLESHDDLISVRDKLSWAKTPRILLVWPKYEKVTLRILDLKVLQRHADSLGAQLGLVTRRMNVRHDAESLGIPVFRTTTAAQKESWGEPIPRVQRTPKSPQKGLRQLRDEVYIQEPAWRTSLLGRVVAFTAGVMAVLVLAGLFVPRAVVTVRPEAQAVSLIIPVNASPFFDSVSLSGEIPAQVISVTVRNEQTVQVSSLVSVPKTKATGVVQFTNLGSDEIAIPAGTVVASNTLIRFATLNETRLPAGVDETVEVKVEALEAGAQGNVESGAISVIEGTLGLSAKITNLEPTTGGSDEEVLGATEEDRATLRDSVIAGLTAIAETQIRSQIGANDLFISDTLTMKDIQSEEFTPPLGGESPTLTYTVDAEFTAHYILEEDLKALASSSVMASIPQGFSPTGDMVLNPTETPFTDATGVTRFSLQATQSTLRDVNIVQVLDLIRGRNIQKAAQLVKDTLVLQNEPQIEITPSWWKCLPLIPFNISVKVQ